MYPKKHSIFMAPPNTSQKFPFHVHMPIAVLIINKKKVNGNFDLLPKHSELNRTFLKLITI
jgi:hypothetical protein